MRDLDPAPDATATVILVQGADFGAQQGWFRWTLDESNDPWSWSTEVSADLLARLASALPTPTPGESLVDALGRSFSGVLAAPDTERALMAELGDALFMPSFTRALVALAEAGARIQVRILPPSSCVLVPWALVVLPSHPDRPDAPRLRLGELADVVDEVPAAFHVARSRTPHPSAGAALRVIDPDLRQRGTRLFTDAQRAALAGGEIAPGAVVTAQDLSGRLAQPSTPRSLLFVGHVTGDARADGTTALRLAPGPGELPADAVRGYLTAADLVLGTTTVPDHPEPRPGAELWPMPPRVGIVACNSGGDLGRREPFGLVVACLNAGAEHVVATRWVLPGDRAFRGADELADHDPQPLFDTANAVAGILDAADPAAALAGFLRSRIAQWEAGPAGAAKSPLTWGALSLTRAPERVVDPAAD